MPDFASICMSTFPANNAKPSGSFSPFRISSPNLIVNGLGHLTLHCCANNFAHSFAFDVLLCHPHGFAALARLGFYRRAATRTKTPPDLDCCAPPISLEITFRRARAAPKRNCSTRSFMMFLVILKSPAPSWLGALGTK